MTASMWFVKVGPEWLGPFLTQHQAGCVAMAFDGTVHSGHTLADIAAEAAEVTEPEPDPHAGQLWANELQSRQRQVPSDREWS